MDRTEFLALLDREHQTIVEINTRKGHDYAGDDDALANFKRQAAALGLKPEQVWAVFAGKHWEAVMTYCREGEVQSEPIKGRIHDIILYSYLLMGLVDEKDKTAHGD